MNVNDLRELAQYVPFLSLINQNHSTNEREGDGMEPFWRHPLVVRLLESVIIGALVMYGSVQKITLELDYVKRQAAEIMVRVEATSQNLRRIEQEQWRMRGQSRRMPSDHDDGP